MLSQEVRDFKNNTLIIAHSTFSKIFRNIERRMHEYPKQTEPDFMIIWGTMEGQMLIKIWAIFGKAKIRRSKLKKIAQ